VSGWRAGLAAGALAAGLGLGCGAVQAACWMVVNGHEVTTATDGGGLSDVPPVPDLIETVCIDEAAATVTLSGPQLRAVRTAEREGELFVFHLHGGMGAERFAFDTVRGRMIAAQLVWRGGVGIATLRTADLVPLPAGTAP
jgi:hypothetical protein